MEYDTPKHSVFDIYNIGCWNIDVTRNFREITPVELIIYFNELIRFCPWLYLKKVWIGTEANPTIIDSHQSYIDHIIGLLKSDKTKNKLEWDLGTFECGLHLKHGSDILNLYHKNELTIYSTFDPEHQKLSFTIDIKIDLFFTNPSRQPNVYLSNEYVEFNRKILKDSLIRIEKSDVFLINNYESEFYPDQISKYGFYPEHSSSEKNVIEDFGFLTETSSFLNVRLEVNTNLYNYNDKEKVDNFVNSSSKGIAWKFGGENFNLFENGVIIRGFPSIDYKRLVVIYPLDHGTHPAPNNALILNPDGSVYMKLSPPTLISDLAKEQMERDPKGPYMVHFDGVSWASDEQGSVVTCVSIIYNREWYEVRILNTATGEFGACLNSGRR